MKGYPVILSFLAVFICACDNNEITSIQSESFIKYYSLNRFNEGACVCEIPGGGYALLGNTTTDLWGSEICLIITDVFGNSTQDPKYFGHKKNDRGNCIKSAPGGGYVILGSTEDTINGDKEVYLIRTNDLGETVWYKTFDQNYGEGFDDDNGDDEGLWFDFNSKEEIMMVGYTFKTDLSGYSKQIWIYHVDKDGNRINSDVPKTTGLSYDVDEARFIQRVDGDNFLITGVSKFSNYAPAASYSFIMYLKSDYISDLQIKSSFEYIIEEDTSTLRDEANSFTLVDNNTLLLCGSRVKISGTSEAYLCRFNSIFTDENKFDPKMEWIRYYNNAGSCKATHMLMESNGINILSTMSSGTDKSSTITLITTDPEGNNPVFLPFGGSSQMKSSNFSFTQDGGFIISGTNQNKDIIDISSMTLIKTKAGGKL
jgi:hypothetical protein